MEEYTIGYRYSAGLINAKQDTRQASTPFLGFAPSFQEQYAEARSCTQSELYSLQCNGEEVETINQHFNGLTFAREKANKANFLQEIEDAQIIHLATHACVNLEEEALSQIFFSDDYLTAVELKNLDLAADLAVLSACNTGSGKLRAGEGLMSLSRSFTIAGCPSTLMSLWSVDDCATSQMMIEFYKQLQEGHDKATAIQNTKLNYLQQAGKAQAHPYYWSAFLLVGDTAAVYSLGLDNYFYPGLLSLTLVIGLFIWWRFKSK